MTDLKYVQICKRCKGIGNIKRNMDLFICHECRGYRFVVSSDKGLIKALADQLYQTLNQLEYLKGSKR
ncbi:hypothetical protein VQ643_15925 [Pseudomonas sp. F1_0610]|uniref:hypothetical protein n=1 Tax=Pseudomonas sp. F1_0610 TaxID=3114284 RepID=UPI0039C39CDC